MALCAICDATNDTTRICEACESSPENADWRHSWEMSIADIDARPIGITLQELLATMPREWSSLTLRILLVRLCFRVEERVRKIDRYGRSRGYRIRKRAATHSEIAHACGCSRGWVSAVIRDTVKFCPWRMQALVNQLNMRVNAGQ